MKSLKTTLTLSAAALGLTACAPSTGGFKDIGVAVSSLDSGVAQVSKFDINKHPLNKTVCEPFGGGGASSPEKGILASLFYVGAGAQPIRNSLDYVTQATRSRQHLFFSDMNVPTRMFTEGFAMQTNDYVKDDTGNKLIEWFGLQFETSLMLPPELPEGDYELATLSDDGTTVKAKINNTWTTIISNDGDHPTRMGCSSNIIHFTRQTVLPLIVNYYQGPRYHISNVLMWRRTDASIVGKDAQCGQLGNNHFFDPAQASQQQQAYKDLLARGWLPVSSGSFFIPMESGYNPCVETAVNPVISNFRVVETFAAAATFAWDTDIASTTQILITNIATGEQTITTTDNVLSNSHQIKVSGIAGGATYTFQAVSISDSLGKSMSAPVTLRFE